MSVSYDKATKEEAKTQGRSLGTVAVAGLNFQGGVTPSEQGEILSLFTKLHDRQTKEKVAAANAPPKTPEVPA